MKTMVKASFSALTDDPDSFVGNIFPKAIPADYISGMSTGQHVIENGVRKFVSFSYSAAAGHVVLSVDEDVEFVLKLKQEGENIVILPEDPVPANIQERIDQVVKAIQAVQPN